MRWAALFLIAFTTAQAQSLDAVLAKMDQAAPGFRGMTSDIEMASFTAVLNDLSKESGTIVILRPREKDTRMLAQFTKPDPRSVSFAGKKLQIFYPKIKTVQEYDLGKQAALIDQFLLLGFGASGSDLKQNYDIKYLGEESLASQKTAHLELTPKSEEARKHVPRVELWIADSNSQPLQQKIWKSAKDYNLITYSDLKLSPTLKEDAVQLKLPAGVKKEYPQK